MTGLIRIMEIVMVHLGSPQPPGLGCSANTGEVKETGNGMLNISAEVARAQLQQSSQSKIITDDGEALCQYLGGILRLEPRRKRFPIPASRVRTKSKTCLSGRQSGRDFRNLVTKPLEIFPFN